MNALSENDAKWIVGVAIRWGVFMIALPRPARHNDVLMLAEQYMQGDSFVRAAHRMNRGGTQGFIDRAGRFLTREEAAAQAIACGQLKKPCEVLVSKDLWR